MHQTALGLDFQRWIALTDAYALQIQQLKLGKCANRKKLFALAQGVQNITRTLTRMQTPA